MRLLSWMPPSAATFIYSVCLKPKPVRAVAQWLVKRIIPSRLTVDGIVLVMNQDDAIVCGALTLGCYETFPRRLFRDLLKPGMTVVDVGANIGLYTAIAAGRVGPAGRVIAVEPEGRNCRLIHQTLELNRFTNVEVVQAAVSDSCSSTRRTRLTIASSIAGQAGRSYRWISIGWTICSPSWPSSAPTS